MGLWLRRALALIGVAAALLLSIPGSAGAETTGPTPPSTASVSASPSSQQTTDPADDTVDAPDVPLDDTRTTLVLVGAGLLALVAGTFVFLRR